MLNQEAASADTFNVKGLDAALPKYPSQKQQQQQPESWRLFPSSPSYTPSAPSYTPSAPSYISSLRSLHQQESPRGIPSSPSYMSSLHFLPPLPDPLQQTESGFDDISYLSFSPTYSPSILPTSPVYCGGGRTEVYSLPNPGDGQNRTPDYYGDNGLFSRVGLHCYNMRMGANFQFLYLHECYTQAVLYRHLTLEATSSFQGFAIFQIVSKCMHKIGDCLILNITQSRLKRDSPGKKLDSGQLEFDEDAVDVLFKVPMPSWSLTDCDGLRYYKMKESEVEEEKEMLQLYVELVLLSKWRLQMGTFIAAKPVELGTVVLVARKLEETKKMVKAENAIFNISFKTRCGRNGIGIIRRTTDGSPEHVRFEAKWASMS
ncbi:unnamed protein product [Cochlearia groenlandica]